MKKPLLISLLFAILLAGCEGVLVPGSGTDPDFDFNTDNTAYNLEGGRITLTLVNKSDTEYYVASPSLNLTLEQQVNEDRWKNLGAWYFIIAVAPSPKPLSSSGYFPQEVPVQAMDDMFSLQPGVYRFEYILYPDTSLSPSNARTIHSNAFILR